MRDVEGVLLGLTAALAWGLTDTAATVASRLVGSLRATVGSQLVSAALLTALALGSGIPLASEGWVVAASAGCGVVAAVAYLAFFTALRHGPISVISPVVSIYGGLTVVLAVVLLGEAPAPGQALGVLVGTGGVALASITFAGGVRRPRPVSPGVAYAIVALVAFAALTVLYAGPIRAAGWLPVLLVSRLVNAATLLVILAVSRWRRRPAVERAARGRGQRTVGLVALAGMLDIGGFIAFAAGLEIAHTWLMGISSSFGPVVAVAVGVLVFGERLRPIQWLGLGLVALSIFLIGLG